MPRNLVFGIALASIPAAILAQNAPRIGAGYTNAIAFGLMVLVLAVRPRGLFGRLSGVAHP